MSVRSSENSKGSSVFLFPALTPGALPFFLDLAGSFFFATGWGFFATDLSSSSSLLLPLLLRRRALLAAGGLALSASPGSNRARLERAAADGFESSSPALGASTAAAANNSS